MKWRRIIEWFDGWCPKETLGSHKRVTVIGDFHTRKIRSIDRLVDVMKRREWMLWFGLILLLGVLATYFAGLKIIEIEVESNTFWEVSINGKVESGYGDRPYPFEMKAKRVSLVIHRRNPTGYVHVRIIVNGCIEAEGGVSINKTEGGALLSWP